MRYKLRSSTKNSWSGSQEETTAEPPSKRLKPGKTGSGCRRKAVKAKQKSVGSQTADHPGPVGVDPADPRSNAAKTDLRSLPVEIIHHILKFCDAKTMLNLTLTCQWFRHMLRDSDTFWKMICTKEELSHYQCINGRTPEEGPQEFVNKMGFAGLPMRIDPDPSLVHWHRVYQRGLQMRRNIIRANYEGWRIYANSDHPVTPLSPDLDLNEVKQKMGNFPKLSMDDDLKIDWDEKYLVVFHFMRREGESCTIRVWDIENEPRFLYQVEKGFECITDKVYVTKKSVVIVPSWPWEADALVMTLGIDEDSKTMETIGKFRFQDDKKMRTIDNHWEHTQLRVVKDMAMVVLKAPEWQCIIVDIPDCQLKYSVNFNAVPNDFDCQQIRSYKSTAMILFSHKNRESDNCLVTMDVSTDAAETKLRSIHRCKDTIDAALFTDPEEVFLLKRNGDVVLFDPSAMAELVKIKNPSPEKDLPQNEYQLFVNRKEQICVMQSSSEVAGGRNIKVYSYDRILQYTINLDKCVYGLSRDESICLYTNGAFLAAADSKKFAIFNVKTGKYLGDLRIPSHLERAKGKDEKFCMFEQTGLSQFIFDEDKLIVVHDYERSYPAVLDIYKFW